MDLYIINLFFVLKEVNYENNNKVNDWLHCCGSIDELIYSLCR